MDITLDVEDYKLNMRSAGVIVHNNKILVHRNINKPHYVLIGGRIEIGENSEETVKREVMEEIGKKIEVTEYIATIENFFYDSKFKYHEILFIHKAEFVNEEDRKIEYTLKNVEGEENLRYEWIDLDNIDDYEILPKVVKEILKERKLPVHRIVNDIY